MSLEHLKKLLKTNQADRLAKEQKERPDLPRHTVYKGDRTIQQLGDQPIDNAVVINNQSLAIGDVVLPLARGNVLRRVDNTNGGALLGSAYRNALENDFDANGRRRGSDLGRDGGLEPSNPSATNRPRRRSNRFPPPFGCTPPPPTCFWSNDPIAPQGFQSYGSAVVNENGVPLYLYCTAGTSVPQNLNCGFLDPQRWKCQNGVCVPDPLGVYSSKAQCEAALIPAGFTGGQCAGVRYEISYRQTHPNPSFVFPETGTNSRPINRTDLGNDRLAPIVRFGTTLFDDGIFGFTTRATVTWGSIPTTDLLNNGGGDPPGVAYTYSDFAVRRQDMLPDLCGDPSPSCPP